MIRVECFRNLRRLRMMMAIVNGHQVLEPLGKLIGRLNDQQGLKLACFLRIKTDPPYALKPHLLNRHSRNGLMLHLLHESFHTLAHVYANMNGYSRDRWPDHLLNTCYGDLAPNYRCSKDDLACPSVVCYERRPRCSYRR